MTKQAYQSHLNIKGTAADYKDMAAILGAATTTTTTVLSSLSNDSVSGDLFKPFNLTRYLHVKEATKKFTITQKTKTLGTD